MQVSTLDWAIVAAYFVFALAIGLYFSRRAGGSLADRRGLVEDFLRLVATSAETSSIRPRNQ